VDLDAAGQPLRLRRARPDEPVRPGLLCPGFTNAHAHLELSAARGRAPGGDGSAPWVRALAALGLDPTAPEAVAAARAAAAEARAAGCAALIDTSNHGHTAPLLADAGLRGAVQLELLGLSPARWGPGLARARALGLRPTAHSPISCAPALLTAALAPPAGPDVPSAGGGGWPTVHVDEDEADAALLADRAGPWAAFHAALEARLPAHPWREALPRAPSGVHALHALGLLRPSLGLVHLAAAPPSALDLVAAAGATAVLCPRSNRHISGRLPDLRGLVARGVPLAVGTDSLASAPDLDPLADAALLRAAAPEVDPAVWMRALLDGGARLWGGRATLDGGDCGALLIALPPAEDPLLPLFDGARWPRRWCR
jgi:cytosine/adenosine deaminase-related metal-dependent hydrolase